MSSEVKYAYLKSHPLFSGMQEQKINEACHLAKLRTVYRGETFSFGEGTYSKIFLLIKGKIKITESNDLDIEMIKDILTSPDVFGDLSLQNHYSHDEQAEAEGASHVPFRCRGRVPEDPRRTSYGGPQRRQPPQARDDDDEGNESVKLENPRYERAALSPQQRTGWVRSTVLL